MRQIIVAASILLLVDFRHPSRFASALGTRGQATILVDDSEQVPVLSDRIDEKSNNQEQFKVARPDPNDDAYDVKEMRKKLLESNVPHEHLPTEEKLASIKEKLFQSIPSDTTIEKKVNHLKSPEGQEAQFKRRMDELKEKPWSLPGQEFANCVQIFSKIPDVLTGDLTNDEIDSIEGRCLETDAETDFVEGFCYDLAKQFAFQYPGLPELATRDVEHVCTYIVDWIDPMEDEPECMNFMFELTFEQAMTHNHGLKAFPAVIREDGFDQTYMTVCEKVEYLGHQETCAENLKNVMPLADKKYDAMVDLIDDLCSALGTPLDVTTPIVRNPGDRYKKRHVLVDTFEKVKQHKYGMIDKVGQPTSPSWLKEQNLSDMLLGTTSSSYSSSVCSGRAYTIEFGIEASAGVAVGASAALGFGYSHNNGQNELYGAQATYWSVCAGVAMDIGFAVTYTSGFFENFGNIAGYSVTTEVEVDLIILSISSGTVDCCDGSGATKNGVEPSKFSGCKQCGSVAGVAFGLGLADMPVGWSQAYCYTEEVGGTKSNLGPYPESPGEGWTDCVSNSMAWSGDYPNRDAMAADNCRQQGYDGVKPNSWKRCGCGGLYTFTCENTSNENWTPCYRDEDGEVLGVGNRDDAGRWWCKNHGYHTWREYQDCGNWYFRFKCIKEPMWSPCFRDEEARAAGFRNRDDQGRHWCYDKGFSGFRSWRDCGSWYFKFYCSD